MARSDETLQRVDDALDALAEGARYRPSRLPHAPVDTRDLEGVDACLADLGEPRALSEIPGLRISALPPARGPGSERPRSSSLPPEAWSARPPRARDEPSSPSGPQVSEPPSMGTSPAPSVPPFVSEPGPQALDVSLPPPSSPPRELVEALAGPPRDDTASPTDALASKSLRELFGEDPDDPDAGSVAAPLPDSPSTTPPASGASSLPDASSLWPSRSGAPDPASEPFEDSPFSVPHPTDPPRARAATPAPPAEDDGYGHFAPTPVRSVSVPAEPPVAASHPPPVPDEEPEHLADLDDLIIVEPEPSEPPVAASAPEIEVPGPPSSEYEDALDDLLQVTDADVTSLPASVPTTLEAPGERSDPSLEIAVDALLDDDPVEGSVMSDDSVAREVHLAPDDAAVPATAPTAPSEPSVEIALEGEEDALADDDDRKGFFSRLFGRK